MTLKQILSLHEGHLTEPIDIECRLMAIDGDGTMRDISLFGGCRYEHGELTPLDGDSYSLDDVYDAHTLANGSLVVWEDVTDALSEQYPISEEPAVERLFSAVDKHIDKRRIDAVRGV